MPSITDVGPYAGLLNAGAVKDAMIAAKTFRDDLYYRLAEIVVTIPALAERAGDAVLLAKHFLRKYAAEMKSPVSNISMACLCATLRDSATIGVEQNRPILTPGVAKRTERPATARSQLATS